MVDEWEKKVNDSGSHVELEVGDYMTHVIADIIAFTAFGNNYGKGKKVFQQQVALINLMGQRDRQRFSAIPRYMFLLFNQVLFLKYLLFITNVNWRGLLCPNASFFSLIVWIWMSGI